MGKSTKEVEVIEVDEVEEAEETAMRPNGLAKELGVDGKRVRAFLRTKFPRNEDEHNTNWSLTDEQIEAVRARFTPSDEDESSEDSE